MTDEKPKRKKSAASAAATTAAAVEVQRVPNATVGEILRNARMHKGLGLEEVSTAIHIRVSQLRALEEGNIDSLPGMTYAMGFVRSYGAYLKLNSAELVQKFKSEHGGGQSPGQNIHFSEPVAERPQPNFVIIGACVFFAVLVLVAWAVFSGGAEEKAMKEAEKIPQAPAVGTMTGITNTPAPAPAQPASLAGSNLLGSAPSEPAQPAPAVAAVQPKAAEPAPAPAAAPVVAEAPPKQDLVTAAPTEATPALPETKSAEVAPAAPATTPDATQAAAPAAATATAAVSAAAAPETPAAPVVSVLKPKPRPSQTAAAPAGSSPDSVIKVRRGNGRIVLAATQTSWIKITSDNGDNILLQKVLHAGDQFFVPDQTGLVLITSNAGGLDVIVDGEKVQPLGKQGQIVRGVDLNPDELKIHRIKARDRDNN